MNQNHLLNGQCLCGGLHYAVEDAFLYAANCHCADCRRATGSAFKPFAGIERSKLTLAQGASEPLIFGNKDGDHDVHCRRCGSLLYSVVRSAQFVHVAMGTLSDEPSLRPTHHIFVGDKAPWFTITDSLPQHQGHV